jgi:hypothetical protein
MQCELWKQTHLSSLPMEGTYLTRLLRIQKSTANDDSCRLPAGEEVETPYPMNSFTCRTSRQGSKDQARWELADELVHLPGKPAEVDQTVDFSLFVGNCIWDPTHKRPQSRTADRLPVPSRRIRKCSYFWNLSSENTTPPRLWPPLGSTNSSTWATLPALSKAP